MPIYFNYDLNDDFYAKNKLMVLAARINFLFFIGMMIASFSAQLLLK